MMRQDWSILPRLLLLVAVLGMVGCSANDPVGDANFPCGPFFIYEGPFQEYPLEWTPDGSQLIFRAGTTLRVIDGAGINLRTLADVNPGNVFLYGFHADVSPDGSQVVYSSCEFPTGEGQLRPTREDFNYEIVAINLDGTDKRRLTLNTHLDHFPAWSPDSNRIAFIANPRNGHAELYLMAADGSDVQRVATTLIQSVTERRGERWATNAQHTRWKKGEGEEIGDEENAWLHAVAFTPPIWSPDGERLAFLVEEGEFRPLQKILYTVRADGTDMRRLAAVEGGLPAWSPDGQRIAVAMYAGDDVALFTLAANGSDPKQITKITDRDTFENRFSRYKSTVATVLWSPDGTEILYSCEFGVCVVDLEDGQVTGLVKGLSYQDYEPYLAAWSPDGTRIAIYTPGDRRSDVPAKLYTVARDGSDRHELILLDDDGNLVPANPPQDE